MMGKLNVNGPGYLVVVVVVVIFGCYKVIVVEGVQRNGSEILIENLNIALNSSKNNQYS